MELPPLPRQLKKREANKTPDIMGWFIRHYPHDAVVEVKIKGNKVESHQMAALEKTDKGMFSYKLPDNLYTRKPADFFSLPKAHAFVVVYDPKTKVCVATRVGNSHTTFILDFTK